MKYERTDAFKRDYRRLSDAEKAQFRKAVRESFHPALEQLGESPGGGWPSTLRVKRVQGTARIWELTPSFTDPDGRATWEWTEVEGEAAVRWRRVGSHSIFRDP